MLGKARDVAFGAHSGPLAKAKVAEKEGPFITLWGSPLVDSVRKIQAAQCAYIVPTSEIRITRKKSKLLF